MKTKRAVTSKDIQICLPERINAVAGDTLEIFFKGVIVAAAPLRYNISVVAPKGKRYSNRWVYAAAENDNDFKMTLEVRDDFGKMLGKADTLVNVIKNGSSPERPINILCVGDSLTSGGKWVHELWRRCCGTGGDPAGDGLTNINFIGTCGTAPVFYEGYGGWTWARYLEETSLQPELMDISHFRHEDRSLLPAQSVAWR